MIILVFGIVILRFGMSIGDCNRFTNHHIPSTYCLLTESQQMKNFTTTITSPTCLVQPPAWQAPDAVLKQFYVFPSVELFKDGSVGIFLTHPIHDAQALLICPQLGTDVFHEDTVRCVVQEKEITSNWIGNKYVPEDGRMSIPTDTSNMWDNPRTISECIPLGDPFYGCTSCTDYIKFTEHELINTGPFERKYIDENHLRVKIELNVCEVYKSPTTRMFWGSECMFHYQVFIDFYRPDGESEFISTATYQPFTYTDSEGYGRLYVDIAMPEGYEILNLEAEYDVSSDPLKFFNVNNDYYENNAMMFFDSENRVPQLAEGMFHITATVRFEKEEKEEKVVFPVTYKLASYITTQTFKKEMEMLLGTDLSEIISKPKKTMMRGNSFFVVLYTPNSENKIWSWGSELQFPDVWMTNGIDMEKIDKDNFIWTNETLDEDKVQELRNELDPDKYLFQIYQFHVGPYFTLWPGYRVLFTVKNTIIPIESILLLNNKQIEMVPQKMVNRKTIVCENCT